MNSTIHPYQRIRVSRPVITLTDRDIDEMLLTLRRQGAGWRSVKRAARPGDRLLLGYTGTIGKRKVVESGASPLTVVLGSGQTPAKLQQSIVGARAGERVTLSIRHRDNGAKPALAGKRVRYEYHVLEVQEERLPPLDRTFARSLGVASGSLRDLRRHVRDILQQQIDHHVRRKIREQLIDGLLELHAAGLPEQLPVTDRQAVLAQIMRQIIRDNGITVDQDKVNAAIHAIAAASEDPDTVAGNYLSNYKLFSGVQASVLENQVLDFVLQQAQITETEDSYEKIRQELSGSKASAGTNTGANQPQLPVIQLTRENKCGFCARSCCTYITQHIDAPRSKAEFSHLLWQVSHRDVEAYRDKRNWYLTFRTDCEHLLPDGRCGNYEQRMAICRKYSNRYCEFDAPAEEGYDLHFRDYDSLLRYCKQRFKNWEY